MPTKSPLSDYTPTSVTPHARNHTHECEVRPLAPPPEPLRDSLGRNRIRGSDPAEAAKLYRKMHHLPDRFPLEVEVMARTPAAGGTPAGPFKTIQTVRDPQPTDA